MRPLADKNQPQWCSTADFNLSFSLQMEYSKAGEMGTEQRADFEAALVNDLSNASGLCISLTDLCFCV